IPRFLAPSILKSSQRGKFAPEPFYIVKPKQGESFTLTKKWSSKTLGKTAIKALVTKGETSKLKGFKSKKGKLFDAKLKLDGHKLSFDFD
ncbi:topoisomerase C-terminal repeat-containing protein, partial [Lactiplantibacillus plantarum]|uniref:topoisomerase C-terminal repeat-containing protein n=7 Tax=Lactiplantibacillus plantarum TaxID=1590 RepID=UPI0021CAF314